MMNQLKDKFKNFQENQIAAFDQISVLCLTADSWTSYWKWASFNSHSISDKKSFLFWYFSGVSSMQPLTGFVRRRIHGNLVHWRARESLDPKLVQWLPKKSIRLLSSISSMKNIVVSSQTMAPIMWRLSKLVKRIQSKPKKTMITRPSPMRKRKVRNCNALKLRIRIWSLTRLRLPATPQPNKPQVPMCIQQAIPKRKRRRLYQVENR